MCTTHESVRLTTRTVWGRGSRLVVELPTDHSSPYVCPSTVFFVLQFLEGKVRNDVWPGHTPTPLHFLPPTEHQNRVSSVTSFSELSLSLTRSQEQGASDEPTPGRLKVERRGFAAECPPEE